MRSISNQLFLLALLFLSTCGFALSQAATSAAAAAAAAAVASALDAFPQCAVGCLELASSNNSICALNDVRCMCTSTKFLAAANVCLAQECTIKERLTTINATQTLCQVPPKSATETFRAVVIVGLVVATIPMILRMTYRWKMEKVFHYDDWCILASYVLIIGGSAMAWDLADTGLGKNTWTLPFENVTLVYKKIWALEILYIFSLQLSKLCFLLFYHRIFRFDDYRRMLYFIMVLSSVAALTFVFVIVFQCSPISFYWTQWDKEHTGMCHSSRAILWALAVFNIICDLLVMITPMWEFFKLKISPRKRIVASSMFLVGLLVTVVSILRLVTIVVFWDSTDITYDSTAMVYLSVLEVDFSLFCACMPTMRKVFSAIIPPTRQFLQTKGLFSSSGASTSSSSSKTPRAALVEPDYPGAFSKGPRDHRVLSAFSIDFTYIEKEDSYPSNLPHTP